MRFVKNQFVRFSILLCVCMKFLLLNILHKLFNAVLLQVIQKLFNLFIKKLFTNNESSQRLGGFSTWHAIAVASILAQHFFIV